MKRVLLIIAAVMLCCCLSMSGRKRDVKFSNAGTAYIERSFSTYDVLQKQIHSLAELGYMEYRSSGLLASHLESNGFRVEMGVAGIPTAFVATFGSGSPVIGLLAEYVTPALYPVYLLVTLVALVLLHEKLIKEMGR